MKYGFILPELIVESIIRDGLENLKVKPEVMDDVFAQLTRAYNTRKYGTSEVTKIKDFVADKDIPVVFSFHEADAKSPCYSIQVGNDQDDKKRAHLGDHYDEIQEDITDPAELAALVKVIGIIPTSYDIKSGQVLVPDSVDLSMTYKGLLYEDGDGDEFVIQGGIDNTPGNKMFFLEPNLEVNIVLPGLIKSSLDYKQFEIRGVTQDVTMVIGVHAKDALTLKYLYILLKYFLLSRKPDMIARGLVVSSISGSDFARDLNYEGDIVFNRFLTITGKVDDTWRSDQVDLIDSITVTVIPDDC